MSNLGVMYDNGLGVEQSYEKAFEYYEQAAQQGDTSAMAHLGVMYANGLGVDQSYERAVEYYEQAAHLGHANAQYNLGILYITGDGVERSPTKAREMFVKAAAQGNENGIKALKKLDKEEGRINMAKTSSDPNVIVCSNCDAEQTESHKLIRCPCHSVQYCNKDCQKKHRKKHKKECRRLMAKKKLKKTK
jgi:TPR repeat protein